jgi:hypothetical protein
MTEIEVLDPATARHTTPVLIARAAARAHPTSTPRPRGRIDCRWPVNDSHIAPVQARGGGFKQSGIGRELDPRGLEDYVEAKHIYLNHA